MYRLHGILKLLFMIKMQQLWTVEVSMITTHCNVHHCNVDADIMQIHVDNYFCSQFAHMHADGWQQVLAIVCVLQYNMVYILLISQVQI